MSASTKKKLRNAQETAKMTERQLAEQKEAKKLKIYTAAFVFILAALLVTAVVIGATQYITTSGVREDKTVAMTVGDYKISNTEMNYFFIDSVNQFYSQNGSYLYLLGLDVTRPLDSQVYNTETGETWADYLLSGAQDTAHTIYAMVAAANEAGHTMTDEEKAAADNAISSIAMYAILYGYADTDSYLKAMYGNGADEESYRVYVENSMLADSYYNAYKDTLVYTDADLRAAEAEGFHNYSSFTYNQYYLAANRFLEGGTADENGTMVYTDEETAASVEAARAAAESLTVDEITTVEELDAAIGNLSINANTTAVSTYYEDYAYAYISTNISDWLIEEGRTSGDKTVVESFYYSTDEAGNEVKIVNGYYVIFFHSVNDNAFPLKNVRHILVSFEGGSVDASGYTTYSDEEKLAAENGANEILREWEAGEATEESFATLATLKSDDTGSTSTGGLYEDIYPGQMVTPFESWCFDESRQPGDTGIVETDYGFHVMYFVGDSDVTFRDFQISNELQSIDIDTWRAEQMDAVTVTEGNTNYVRTGLILSNG